MTRGFCSVLVAFLLSGAVGCCLTPVADNTVGGEGGTSGGDGGGTGGTSGGTEGVMCRKSCPAHSSCDPATTVDGRCICDLGYDVICPGVCVDLNTDPGNCGFCDNACPCYIGSTCSSCFGGICR